MALLREARKGAQRGALPNGERTNYAHRVAQRAYCES